MSLKLTDEELREISRKVIEKMTKDKVVTRIMEGTYVPDNNDELNDLLRKATNDEYLKDNKLDKVFKTAYLKSQGKYQEPKWRRICTYLNKNKWLILATLFLLFCVGYTLTEVYIGFMYGVY